MAKFIISQRANGQYYFSLKAENGQIILTSEGYTSKMGCMNGIESVKRNSIDEGRFDRKTSANGKFYFYIKALNGQILGTSELYYAAAKRDNGIEYVKRTASTALVNDTSA